jgi:hypothetical protein
MPCRHLARQSVASGQAFWQSGRAGFSGGQQGMSSDMAVATMSWPVGMSTDGELMAPPIALAGVARGDKTRPRTARTGSNRLRACQMFTWSNSHMCRDPESPRLNT